MTGHEKASQRWGYVAMMGPDGNIMPGNWVWTKQGEMDDTRPYQWKGPGKSPPDPKGRGTMVMGIPNPIPLELPLDYALTGNAEAAALLMDENRAMLDKTGKLKTKLKLPAGWGIQPAGTKLQNKPSKITGKKGKSTIVEL